MIFASVVEPLDRDPVWLRYRVELAVLRVRAAIELFAPAMEALRLRMQALGDAFRALEEPLGRLAAALAPYREETR